MRKPAARLAGALLLLLVLCAGAGLLQGPSGGAEGWQAQQAWAGQADTQDIQELAAACSWGNADTLEDHYERHGAAAGAASMQEYARRANELYLQRGEHQVKVDDKGITRVYDEQSGLFGAYNPDGTTRTFFLPDKGQAYFDGQPGEIS